ncbi:MAG: inorganic pyrophosphatase [Chloroflexia bacterium]|nr:inorganic pyrophosphatase [Chloroflexia bacterium]
MDRREPLQQILGMLFKAHPWHGVPIGQHAPEVVTAYIELVPTDTVKYELDKYTGHLMIDRPQVYSNFCPTLYGVIPQTYCGQQIAAFSNERTGREDIVGDKDPLDICVLCEKDIFHGDILLQARPIGGLRMIDRNEADDKIVAVMEGDAVYSFWRDISDCPQPVIDRLRHYFLTYKRPPESEGPPCQITHIYGREEAYEVIRRAQADYSTHLSDMGRSFSTALGNR